jgi:hypothetical protein
VGADTEIQSWESDMTVGSHHLLVFYKAGATDDPLESDPNRCNGLEFHSGPYGAQTPQAKITYPDGVAAFVSAGNGLRLSSHYLNASPNTITANVKVIARKATPGTVQNHSGVFFFNNIGLVIPTGAMNYPVTKTCSVPRDVYFMFSVAHMHKHAIGQVATSGGQTIYQTNTWESQFAQYTPAMFMKAGTQITFTCTYNNDSGGPLTFGESAQSNEMCIFDGQFYPDPTGQGFGCM